MIHGVRPELIAAVPLRLFRLVFVLDLRLLELLQALR